MGTFTRTGLAADQSDKMVVDGFHDLLLFHINWQFLSKLYDFFCSLDYVVACWNGDIGMSNIFKTIRLIFIIRKFNFLYIFNDFQRFLAKRLEIDFTTH